jgi:hypothetical protein
LNASKWEDEEMLKATVSGSFHRHMPAIDAAVSELWARGVEVLSPANPQVVDFKGEFLFVASDRLRSIKLVQDRHFEAIGQSDFLWVVCPDGYTGPSSCLEIGYASRAGVRVYSDRLPLDITVQYYVEKVPSIGAAMELASRRRRVRATPVQVLLDPNTSIEHNIHVLERLKRVLAGVIARGEGEAERAFEQTRDILSSSFGLTRAK